MLMDDGIRRKIYSSQYELPLVHKKAKGFRIIDLLGKCVCFLSSLKLNLRFGCINVFGCCMADVERVRATSGRGSKIK